MFKTFCKHHGYKNTSLLIAMLSSTVFFCSTSFAMPESSSYKVGNIISGEARVVDGDTIAIGGAKIRLHGIDAPEKSQKCYTSSREIDCGLQAKQNLQAMVGGKITDCVVMDKDRYGRVVAKCSVSVNASQVKDGMAVAYSRYSKDYDGLQKIAKNNSKGIWATYFERPDQYRKNRRKQS